MSRPATRLSFSFGLPVFAVVALLLCQRPLCAQFRTNQSRLLDSASYSGSFSLLSDASGSSSDPATGIASSYTIHHAASGTLNAPSFDGSLFAWVGTATGTATIHENAVVSFPNGCTTTVDIVASGPLETSSSLVGFIPRTAYLGLDITDDGWSLWFSDSHIDGTQATTSVCPDQGTQTFTRNAAFVFTPVAREAGLPVPASGLNLQGTTVIPGQGSDNLGLALSGQTYTFTYNFVGVPDPLELVIDPQGYDTWTPEAGADETTPGNTITVNAKLRHASGRPIYQPAMQFTFNLANVSHEPGIALNYPIGAFSPGLPDLQFTSDSNSQLMISGTEQNIAQTLPGVFTQSSAVVTSFDWGAWGEIRVTATFPSGAQLTGFLITDPSQTSVRLPKRAANSNIADIWKQNNGVTGKPDDDDSETDPTGKSDCIGDGLTLYEEYRGFIENGKHIQGNPLKKDFFIENLDGPDAEPGIWLFTDLTGLLVHKDLRQNEMNIGDPHALGAGADTRMINENHLMGAHVTDQHGVIIATCSNTDGGDTTLNAKGVRGRPYLTNAICMQPRDKPGSSLDPSNTHPFWVNLVNAGGGSITPSDAFLQYDLGVAHELSHSVGVEHHGPNDDYKQFFHLIGPSSPFNSTGQPLFRIFPSIAGSIDVKLLEENGNDVAAEIYQKLKLYYTLCQGVLTLPSLFPDSVVFWCKEILNDLTIEVYTGVPMGQHSGDDTCIMRYFFANTYPSASDPNTFYLVNKGTEPVGSQLCTSPAGTGVNDPNRTLPVGAPQPRYFNAAPGRGACQSWVCVNDKYPPFPE